MVMTKTMGFKWQQKQKGRAKNNLYFRLHLNQDKGQMGQWDNGTMEKKTKKIGRVHMNRANKKVIKGIELN
jgi:hypothetical protein